MQIPRSERTCGNCIYHYRKVTKNELHNIVCRRTPNDSVHAIDDFCGEGMWIGIVNGHERQWDYKDHDDYEGCQTSYEHGNELNVATELLKGWYNTRNVWSREEKMDLCERTRKFLGEEEDCEVTEK